MFLIRKQKYERKLTVLIVIIVTITTTKTILMTTNMCRTTPNYKCVFVCFKAIHSNGHFGISLKRWRIGLRHAIPKHTDSL